MSKAIHIVCPRGGSGPGHAARHPQHPHPGGISRWPGGRAHGRGHGRGPPCSLGSEAFVTGVIAVAARTASRAFPHTNRQPPTAPSTPQDLRTSGPRHRISRFVDRAISIPRLPPWLARLASCRKGRDGASAEPDRRLGGRSGSASFHNLPRGSIRRNLPAARACQWMP